MTNVHDHNSAVERIRALDARGVRVAQGNGSVWQKSVVLLVQTFGAAALLVLLPHNLWMLVALPVVCLLIDFLSGVVHWFRDTQVPPGPTPLGRIAVDFLDHHVHPQRTCEVGFVVSAHRPAMFVALPLTAFSLALGEVPVVQALVFWIGFLSLYIPQTHKLTHRVERGSLITSMQKVRIILPPTQHQTHHRDNAVAYCVFTGWLNGLLDRKHFWRRLERLFPPTIGA